MNDMKCVKCNSDLERIGDFYTCTNPHCTLCGDKDMWQELIRTRGALDVAIDEVTKIKVAAESVGIGFFMTAAIVALVKIKTALTKGSNND